MKKNIKLLMITFSLFTLFIITSCSERELKETFNNAIEEIDKNTVSTDEALEMQENIKKYKNEFLESGLDLKKEINTSSYNGYTFYAGDFSFNLVFTKSTFGHSGIFISKIIIPSQYSKRNISIESSTGNKFDFYYINSENGNYISNESFKDNIYSSSIYLILEEMDNYSDYSGNVKRLFKIFDYCEENFN